MNVCSPGLFSSEVSGHSRHTFLQCIRVKGWMHFEQTPTLLSQPCLVTMWPSLTCQSQQKPHTPHWQGVLGFTVMPGFIITFTEKGHVQTHMMENWAINRHEKETGFGSRGLNFYFFHLGDTDDLTVCVIVAHIVVVVVPATKAVLDIHIAPFFHFVFVL